MNIIDPDGLVLFNYLTISYLLIGWN